jgi:hypothetical protein
MSTDATYTFSVHVRPTANCVRYIAPLSEWSRLRLPGTRTGEYHQPIASFVQKDRALYGRLSIFEIGAHAKPVPTP